MQNIIFTYEGDVNEINIGDYIQSLAAMQFTKGNIVYWQRDRLDEYHGEKAKAIMNGWFMHAPSHWPPSDDIIPLFLSFHISREVQMTSDKCLSYYKKFEPIGCRDEWTAKLLLSKGIKAYFSSCLTTTLGLSYKYQKGSKIYLVDLAHFIPELETKRWSWRFLFYYLCNMKGVNSYANKLKANNAYELKTDKKYWKRWASIIRSYIIAKQILSKEDLEKAIPMTQMHLEHEYPTNESRFKRANELLRLYSNAKLVVTSRIHCALPCVGIGTPVLMLRNEEEITISANRFQGLENMFHNIWFRRNKVTKSNFKLPIDTNNISNPTNYKQYADRLAKTCTTFLNGKNIKDNG